jgi:hypothetical protein
MPAPRLKIYTERDIVQPGEAHVPMLNPFWGHGAAVMNRADFADRYAERGHELFELADLPDADLAVYPVDWKRARDTAERVQRAHDFAQKARDCAKPRPTVVFYAADQDEPVPLESSVVFRTSMSRSRRRPNEFALPGFHEDMLEYVDWKVRPRAKSALPTVSFCGFVFFEDRARTFREALRGRAATAKRLVLERLERPADHDVYIRARALEALLHQRRYVKTEFILRSQGGGGGWSDRLSPAVRPWNDVRQEYVRSIVDSDYVLCARGIGNWSYRLYETLSLGRIPVFIDTDCVLPYDFAINWRDYCVWITRSEVSTIGERVAEFHESLSENDFVERQHACRKLWEDYVSPQGFFSNLYKHFPI